MSWFIPQVGNHCTNYVMQDIFRRLLLLEGQAIPYSDANLNDSLLSSKKDTTEMYSKPPEPILHFDILSF